VREALHARRLGYRCKSLVLGVLLAAVGRLVSACSCWR
jgi:hypothetical protein